jgi:hypothetical protein
MVQHLSIDPFRLLTDQEIFAIRPNDCSILVIVNQPEDGSRDGK